VTTEALSPTRVPIPPQDPPYKRPRDERTPAKRPNAHTNADGKRSRNSNIQVHRARAFLGRSFCFSAVLASSRARDTLSRRIRCKLWCTHGADRLLRCSLRCLGICCSQLKSVEINLLSAESRSCSQAQVRGCTKSPQIVVHGLVAVAVNSSSHRWPDVAVGWDEMASTVLLHGQHPAANGS
jgi:hypothetical protein